MESRKKAFLTDNSAMLLYGLSAVLVGPTLPGMITEFGLSLSRAGLIGAMQNAGGFLGALVALAIADRISHAKGALVSFILLGAALFLLGFADSYLFLLLAIAGSGLCIRVLDVMLNAHTGSLAGARSDRYLSTLHLFFSIGAFVGPVVARGVMRSGVAWDGVYKSVGLAYLLAVVLASGWLHRYAREGGSSRSPRASLGGSTPQSSAGDREGDSTGAVTEADEKRNSPGARGYAAILLIGVALFFYAIHQVGVTSWVPYYLETVRGAGADSASLGLSAYWLGIILGRFLVSRIVERTGGAAPLVLGAFLSGGLTLAAVAVGRVSLALPLLLLAGATSGATIPLAYSLGFSFVPHRTGMVTAAVSLLMLIGRFLGPWSVGVVADRATATVAMTIPGWALLATGSVLWVTHLLRKTPSASPPA